MRCVAGYDTADRTLRYALFVVSLGSRAARRRDATRAHDWVTNLFATHNPGHASRSNATCQGTRCRKVVAAATASDYGAGSRSAFFAFHTSASAFGRALPLLAQCRPRIFSRRWSLKRVVNGLELAALTQRPERQPAATKQKNTQVGPSPDAITLA